METRISPLLGHELQHSPSVSSTSAETTVASEKESSPRASSGFQKGVRLAGERIVDPRNGQKLLIVDFDSPQVVSLFVGPFASLKCLSANAI
ncbi:UNVERIFIED_CONTAM: hypothetical protein HHA_454710 [Hammondia hammondi]|eukprot:XP_008888314.1 hypothetical protein HHA_454710 [Hammondia hammondi]